jgi:hypothetical protein
MSNVLHGCAASDGEERDGYEFEVTTLRQLVGLLIQYKEIHLNHFDNEADLDIWVKREG